MKLAAVSIALLALTPSVSQAPTRVQVSSTEFELALSRQKVKQGRAIVQLVNLGEDPHDLALRRIAKDARTYKTKVVLPEQDASISFRLYPGRYVLWCTIADHRALGMHATLTVTK